MRNSWGVRLSRFAILAGLLAALALPSAAQTVRGSIGGVVKDPTGAVIPGAKVILIQLESNRERLGETDTKGEFAFFSLSAGPYRLRAEHPGLKTDPNLFPVLQVNQQLRVTVDMEFAAADVDYAFVQEAPELMQTSSATRSTVIENRQVTQLPLDGRNFFELSLLVPGRRRRRKARPARCAAISPST